MKLSSSASLIVLSSVIALAPIVTADNPDPAPMVTACSAALKVKAVPKCTDTSSAQNAAGFVSCKPNECQIRVYEVVSSAPIQTSDAPPCCPRYDIRDKYGDYSQDCGRCTVLAIEIPPGSKMTRFRVAAADTTHGPAGEGYCPDNAVCPALPYSSFGSYREQKLPSGATRISVQFKNWRHDKGRRGAFAVWFTPPPEKPPAQKSHTPAPSSGRKGSR